MASVGQKARVGVDQSSLCPLFDQACLQVKQMPARGGGARGASKGEAVGDRPAKQLHTPGRLAAGKRPVPSVSSSLAAESRAATSLRPSTAQTAKSTVRPPVKGKVNWLAISMQRQKCLIELMWKSFLSFSLLLPTCVAGYKARETGDTRTTLTRSPEAAVASISCHWRHHFGERRREKAINFLSHTHDADED